MKDTLIAITTYNHSDHTKLLLESIKKINTTTIDVCIVDNCSTDDTREVCKEFDVEFYGKKENENLTHSINMAYNIFKNSDYTYLAIVNNDILIPAGAIEELKEALSFRPSSIVVPMSTERGCGHNKVQSIDRIYGPDPEREKPENYQSVQDQLLEMKKDITSKNNLYLLDPVRMKMFNGFFFMLHKRVSRCERPDGNIFDPSFANVKNEDEFNWKQLIPNNDFPLLCKTSFVYHFKGVTCTPELRF